MGSTLLQLVAYGAQDVYLTGHPQITYFKNIHKRHTNFAMEEIEIPITGSINPGSKVSVTITRNGDLLKGLYMQYKPNKIIPKSSYIQGICSDLGHSLIESMEIEIGGQVIDKHYGIWLTIWRDLTEVNPYASQFSINSDGGEFQNYYKYLEYTKESIPGITPGITGTLGRYGEITIKTFQTFLTKYQTMAYTHKGINKYPYTNLGTYNAPTEAYVPLQFWFCRNPGLAIPLIALQYHEVKLNITFAKKQDFIIPVTDYKVNDIPVDLSSIKFFGEYVFLDAPERKKFASEAHEYLIDQLQYQDIDYANATSVELNFNHPIKELIITGKPQSVINDLLVNTHPDNPFITITNPYYKSVWGGATPYPIIVNDSDDTFGAPTTDLKLQLVLNQNDRFSSRNLKYFTRQQILQLHTGSGSVTDAGGDNIAVYSFCLNPQDQQPSGSCNFSRIDRAVLFFYDRKPTETLNPLNIYALNHNIFRVMSGMGGLAYSN